MERALASQPRLIFGPYGSGPTLQALAAAMFHATADFGTDVARGAAESAAELGVQTTVIGFPSGGAVRAANRVPDAEVLLVVGGFEDELAAARALLGRACASAAVAFGSGLRPLA